jgi:hypothetical protein
MEAIVFLSSPAVVVVCFIVFIVLYFTFLGIEGSFGSDFLLLGPDKTSDESQLAYFMGIPLNTWSKVTLIYFISFMTGLLLSLHELSVTQDLVSQVYDPEITNIHYSMFATYGVMLADPFIKEALNVIFFFTYATLQLQFIIPGLLGKYLIHIPYILSVLSTKAFV